MTDKQQIEELTKDLSVLQNCGMVMIESQMDWRGSTHKEIKNKVVAEALYNVNYRKIPEGSIVVDKEYLKKELQGLELQARKETAKEILTEWADCDCETGGYNLPYIHERAKKFGVGID